MFTNFEVKNIEESEDIEIEGEVMLMRMHDYIPSALSATARLDRRAGKFICHFEVCSKNDFFVTEVDATDFQTCIKGAEIRMLKKIGIKSFKSNRSLGATMRA